MRTEKCVNNNQNKKNGKDGDFDYFFRQYFLHFHFFLSFPVLLSVWLLLPALSPRAPPVCPSAAPRARIPASVFFEGMRWRPCRLLSRRRGPPHTFHHHPRLRFPRCFQKCFYPLRRSSSEASRPRWSRR